MTVTYHYIFTTRNEVCEGYVFTCVCLSTGGWYPSMPCRSLGVCVSQHALQVSRPTPKGELEASGWGVSRSTPRGGGEWGAPGPHLGGVSRPTPGGGAIPACTEIDPPPQPDGYCCGWYASYWKAFLFFLEILHFTLLIEVTFSQR